MNRFILMVTAAVAIAAPGAASAGIYADDLSKCLVKSATASDQTSFMVWMFMAMSRHPSVQPYAKVTDVDRNIMNKRAADLMVRLITVDCRAETVAGLKYEGASILETAFTVFGGVAGRGLMNNPNVAKGMEELAGFIDRTKIEAVVKEAGLPVAEPDPSAD